MSSAIQRLLDSFAEREPMVDVWRRYPTITEAERDATDTWGSRQASDAFTDYARRNSFKARVVEAGGAMDHYWVRLDTADGSVDVDWTARRFHDDLHYLPLSEAVDLACPLVWLGWPDRHPALRQIPRPSA